MKGIPCYTQHSVAFPTLPLGEHRIDELGISFQAKGGGSHGEFRFLWISLTNYQYGALQVQAFSDGLTALLDPRIVRVLDRIRRLPDARRDISPATLIGWLEAEGVGPSLYHLRGLDNGNLSLASRQALAKKIKRLRKHEAWA